MNTTPDEYLQALLNSAKGGDLKIESLDIVSHVDSDWIKTGTIHSQPNGRHTITIKVQEQTK